MAKTEEYLSLDPQDKPRSFHPKTIPSFITDGGYWRDPNDWGPDGEEKMIGVGAEGSTPGTLTTFTLAELQARQRAIHAKYPMKVADLDKDIQMSFYSLAYRLMFNEPEKGIRLDCVIKTKNKKTFQIATNRTTEELQWTVNLIKETAKAMGTGIYPPNPSGWWCSLRWCGVYE